MRTAEAASASLGITVTPVGLRSATEVEPALRAFAKEPDGGLIVAPSPFNTVNQNLVIALASELRLPAPCDGNISPMPRFERAKALSLAWNKNSAACV
jgi:hypothetical protein